LLEMAVVRRPADLGLLMALAGTYPRNQWEGSEERVRWCQAAVAAAPGNTAAHNILGIVLHDRKDLTGAEAAAREAIRLDPKYAPAHNNLGIVLHDRKDLPGAVAAFRQAIHLVPKFADAHNNLGIVLQQKGDLDSAVAAFKQALQIQPKHPYALANLPRTERMRWLLPRLPAVLAGKDAPKGPAEACDFARLGAEPFQKRYAAATRLFEQAFATDAILADDLAAGYRYSATCSAVRAARGDGVDAPANPAERAALRGKALAWLQADLALRKKQAASANAADRKTVAARLTHWLADTDLSDVREPKALENLPADEQKQWRNLWAEVRATLAEARKPPPPPERLPPPEIEPQ
jgi:tetratricopeptide (TPR) repeat protein